MKIVFQEKFVCMSMQMDASVYETVRDVIMQKQDLQQEGRPKLFGANEIEALVDDDVCEDAASEVGVRINDVCGLDEPIYQRDTPERMDEVAKKQC